MLKGKTLLNTYTLHAGDKLALVNSKGYQKAFVESFNQKKYRTILSIEVDRSSGDYNYHFARIKFTDVSLSEFREGSHEQYVSVVSLLKDFIKVLEY